MKFLLSCCFVLFMSLSQLFAGWNSIQKSEIVNSSSFQELENRVISFIRGSWCSEEKAKLIMELIVSKKPKSCVEIGAFTGSCTIPMLTSLQYLKNGRAYVIDSWSNKEAIKDLPTSDPNTKWWEQINMRMVKQQFNSNMKQWNLYPYFIELHMPSYRAIHRVPQIDFLHIDGNFSEQGSCLDVNTYLPKVVSGGYILISNALIVVNNKVTKSKSFGPLFEKCKIVHEIDMGNTLLFKKR